MNKGLAIHLIVTLIYIIAVTWVVQDFQLNVRHRTMIAGTFFLIHFPVAMICELSDYYDKKIK